MGMFLVFHVIFQDYVIKGSYDIIGGSPFRFVTTLPSLVTIGIVIVERKCI